MKKDNGVTLIALVITIIVLLILAAVSIAMLTGDNGIITNAQTAKEDNEKGTEAERINAELAAFKADIIVDGVISETTFTGALGRLPETSFKYSIDGTDKSSVAYTTIYTSGAPTGKKLTITSIQNSSVYGEIYLQADTDATKGKIIKATAN